MRHLWLRDAWGIARRGRGGLAGKGKRKGQGEFMERC